MAGKKQTQLEIEQPLELPPLLAQLLSKTPAQLRGETVASLSEYKSAVATYMTGLSSRSAQIARLHSQVESKCPKSSLSARADQCQKLVQARISRAAPKLETQPQQRPSSRQRGRKDSRRDTGGKQQGGRSSLRSDRADLDDTVVVSKPLESLQFWEQIDSYFAGPSKDTLMQIRSLARKCTIKGSLLRVPEPGAPRTSQMANARQSLADRLRQSFLPQDLVAADGSPSSPLLRQIVATHVQAEAVNEHRLAQMLRLLGIAPEQDSNAAKEDVSASPSEIEKELRRCQQAYKRKAIEQQAALFRLHDRVLGVLEGSGPSTASATSLAAARPNIPLEQAEAKLEDLYNRRMQLLRSDQDMPQQLANEIDLALRNYQQLLNPVLVESKPSSKSGATTSGSAKKRVRKRKASTSTPATPTKTKDINSPAVQGNAKSKASSSAAAAQSAASTSGTASKPAGSKSKSRSTLKSAVPSTSNSNAATSQAAKSVAGSSNSKGASPSKSQAVKRRKTSQSKAPATPDGLSSGSSKSTAKPSKLSQSRRASSTAAASSKADTNVVSSPTSSSNTASASTAVKNKKPGPGNMESLIDLALRMNQPNASKTATKKANGGTKARKPSASKGKGTASTAPSSGSSSSRRGSTSTGSKGAKSSKKTAAASKSRRGSASSNAPTPMPVTAAPSLLGTVPSSTAAPFTSTGLASSFSGTSGALRHSDPFLGPMLFEDDDDLFADL